VRSYTGPKQRVYRPEQFRGVQNRTCRATAVFPAPPHVPGFDIAAASYPAVETGGDYFDFIAAPNDALYRIMDSTGVPLGLFPDATFATHEFQFETQDILVLGTDGGTETSDGDGTEFGRNGVIEYVRTHVDDSAREIAAGVYGAARSFGAAEPQHDDITSVIVKVTGPSPPGSRRDVNTFLQSVDESAA